jgi:hypothetical protein
MSCAKSRKPIGAGSYTCREVAHAIPPRSFDARPDLAALASEQGVEPAGDVDALLGDFWPEDEGADEFVSALRTWRRDDIEIVEHRPEAVVPRTS